MKRFHTAVLAAAAVLSVLGSAALAQADDDVKGTEYLQDPAGGNKAMKSQWTKGDRHKLSGRFRFRPGMDYRLKDRTSPQEAKEWGAKTPDLDTLVYRPAFEFSYEIATRSSSGRA
ncbi:hypothetical protein ACM614_00880 [Streptomyces sp. 12297]